MGISEIERLEGICGRDVGRGIGALAAGARGGLEGAARSIAGHPEPHVVILTGFFIPRARPPAAETDGPPGAAHLAAALGRVGVPVRLVTDDLCAGAVRAAARAAGVASVPVDVLRTGAGDDDVESILRSWTEARPPVSHAVSIERAGPSSDGTVRNARGEDITAFTAPLDRLFEGGAWLRIGIGDGGNELGMGALPSELVAAHVRHGERIACRVGCDHLVVCGVSNWGAWALAAALAVLRDDWRPRLVDARSVETERRILETTIVEGPAVDGMTQARDLSVDRRPWDRLAAVLEEIWQT